MPRENWKLTQDEARDYRSWHLRLQQMGVAVGSDGGYLSKPASRLAERLRLEQNDPATIFDLPGMALAFVLPAGLLVLATGSWIRRSEVVLAWDSPELELSGCEQSPYYDKLISGFIPYPPKLLNPFLTGELPLRRGAVAGVIVAISYTSVPAIYPDHTAVPVELFLYDEWDQELHYTFEASVSRSLKVAYEREQRRNHATRPRERIFGELFGDDSKIAAETGSPSVDASIGPQTSAQVNEQEKSLGTVE